MADLTYSMLFKAETVQANAAVTGLAATTDRLGDSIAAAGATAVAASDEIAGVGTAGATSAADMLAAADASAEYGSAIQMIRAAVQPMVAEHAALQDAVRTLTVLEDAGAISSREAALAHDLVARQAIELSARMEAAGVSIDGTTASIARQATSAQQMINGLTGVDRATGQTVAETLRHGQALDQLRAKYNPLFAASRQYEVALGEIAEAERLGAISTMEAAVARDRAAAALAPVPDQLTRVGASSNAAASYMGQLSFQFNDIGMMLASGQSPFMLMVQQGPQVVQVLSEMRNRGMALGPAIAGTFTSMLNPMSLATMAIIGFGAAAVQWLMASSEEAKTLDEVVDDLAERVDKYASATDRALMPAAELVETFGRGAEKAREYARELAEVERREAERSARTAMQTLRDGVAPKGWFESSYGGLAESFELDQLKYDDRQLIDPVWSALDGMDKAKGLEDQLAALEQLKAAYTTAAQASGSFNAAEDSALAAINTLLLDKMRLLQQIERQKAADRAAEGRGSQDGDEQELAEYRAAQGAARREDLATAQELTQTLIEEAEIQALIRQYGEDSVQVTVARAMAEREAFQTMVDGLDVADQVKVELMEAWEAAKLLSGTNIAAAIETALGPASQLGDLLWRAANAWDQAKARFMSSVPGAAAGSGPGFEKGGRSGSTSAPYVDPGPQTLDEVFKRNQVGPYGRSSGTSGGAGGGGGAAKERDELKELIDAQNRQIEALQTTDPVQKEIQKNHEALAKAGDKERQAVEALIRERMQLENVRKQIDEIGKTGERAFVGLVTGAHSFSDALSMMLDKLAEMAASSAWDLLWSGGGGDSGWGGLSGLIGGWLGLDAKADGGMIQGRGGPRDDRVLTRTSPGEYVVNAAATARNLPLVEAINNGASVDQMMAIIGGTRPGYADGGMIGAMTGNAPPQAWRAATQSGAGSSLSGSGGAGQVGVRIFFDSRKGDWSAEVQRISGEVAAEVVKEGIGLFSDQMLPDRMAEIDSNPRVRG